MPITSAPAAVPEAHERWLSGAGVAAPRRVALYEYSVRRIIAWRGDPDLLTLSRFEALSYVRMRNASFKPNGVHSRVKSSRVLLLVCGRSPHRQPGRTDAYLAARGARTTPDDQQVDHAGERQAVTVEALWRPRRGMSRSCCGQTPADVGNCSRAAPDPGRTRSNVLVLTCRCDTRGHHAKGGPMRSFVSYTSELPRPSPQQQRRWSVCPAT